MAVFKSGSWPQASMYGLGHPQISARHCLKVWHLCLCLSGLCYSDTDSGHVKGRINQRQNRHQLIGPSTMGAPLCLGAHDV